MEERVPHPHPHPHPNQRLPEDRILPDLDPHSDAPLPSETYVVQIPKDQIYRVPPPENALIVERYRNPSRLRSNGRGSYCCCCGWVCCVLLAIIVLLLVGLAVVVDLFSVFAKAQDPIFHVESFQAKNAMGGHEFDVRLTAENPNKYSDVVYKQGGVSFLAFKQKKIASGKFPAFLQDRKCAADTSITLRDSGGKLPAEIKTGMLSKKTVPRLSFTLGVTVTARMSAGFFQQHDVDLSISCHYTVDKLTGGTNILSEECSVEHG